MPISWIEYKGKKILYEDYSNLKGDKMLDVLFESEEEFKKLTSPTLVLMNYTNCKTNKKYMDELKRLGKKYDSLFKKSANVGIVGIQKILSKGYLRFTGQAYKIGYFDTIEEAKNYLTE